MSYRTKIEAMGYKVTSILGYRNGVQGITAYSCIKNGRTYQSATLKGLYRLLTTPL